MSVTTQNRLLSLKGNKSAFLANNDLPDKPSPNIIITDVRYKNEADKNAGVKEIGYVEEN